MKRYKLLSTLLVIFTYLFTNTIQCNAVNSNSVLINLNNYINVNKKIENMEPTIFYYNHFGYYINENDEVVITSYGFDLDTVTEDLSIPNYINGRKVVALGPSIFYSTEGTYPYQYNIKRIKCSDFMETVDMRSFNGAQALKTITLGKYTKHYKFPFLDQTHDSIIIGFTIKCPPKSIYLKTIRGALYSKNGKILYRCPNRKKKRTGFSVSNGTEYIDKYAIAGYAGYRTLKLGSHLRKIDKKAIVYSGIQRIKMPARCYKKYMNILKRSGITKKYMKKRNIKIIRY